MSLLHCWFQQCLPAVTMGFDSTAYATEEGTTVEVCAVIISGMLEREAVVTLTSRDGSAESERELGNAKSKRMISFPSSYAAGADYTAVSSDLVFSETVSRDCRNVSTKEDDTLEGDEQFLLDLMTSDRSVQLSPNEATVMIADDGNSMWHTALFLSCLRHSLEPFTSLQV